MTGRGVTVVVVDDGVEHTIKDIQPNYVSACTGWRLGSATGVCESSESNLRHHLGLSQNGKYQQKAFPGRFGTRVLGLPAFVQPVGCSWHPSDPQQCLELPWFIPSSQQQVAVLSCSPVRKQPVSSHDFQPVFQPMLHSLNSCFSQTEEGRAPALTAGVFPEPRRQL